MGLVSFRLSLRCRGIISLICLILLQHTEFVSSTLCYTPDGTISNDVPCNSTADASVCCTAGFLCTSNSLCMPAGWWDGSTGNELQFIRGTCTDKTWSSPECPENCVAESVNGGEWVMRCGKNSSKYCCSADDCCSKESSNLFSMADPRITATAGVAAIVTSVNGTTTTIPTTTPAPTIASASASISTTAGQIATQPTSTKTSTETSSSAANTSLSHSQVVAIGAGAGAGGGVLALGCLVGCFLWRKRRRRRREEALATLNHARSSRDGSEWDQWSQSASRHMSPPVKELASNSPFDRGIRELHASRNHRSIYEVE